MRFLLFVFGLTLSFGAAATSFDCNDARSLVEKQICGSPGVSALDEVLANEYQKAIARASPGAVQQSQRDWLRTRRDRCPDVACLVRVYDDRISELQAIRATRIPPIAVPTAPPRERFVVPSVQLAGTQNDDRVRAAQLASVPHEPMVGVPTLPPREHFSPSVIQAAPAPARVASVEMRRNSEQHVGPQASLATPNKESSSNKGLFGGIAALLIFIAQAATPKRDRRFKTGYKENRVFPTFVPKLYFGAAVAVALMFFF